MLHGASRCGGTRPVHCTDSAALRTRVQRLCEDEARSDFGISANCRRPLATACGRLCKVHSKPPGQLLDRQASAALKNYDRQAANLAYC